MLRINTWSSGLAVDRRVKPRSSSASASIDEAMVWVVAALMLFGLVMVYSASIAFPESPKYSGYTSTHFLIRHAISMCIGLGQGITTVVERI